MTESTTPVSDRRADWRCFLLAGLPFLLSVAFTIAGPRPASVPLPPEKAGLAFDEYLIDFGSRPLSPQPQIGVVFRFRNTCSSPIRITNTDVSCGCLKPTLDQQEYAPGESGELTLRVLTANQDPGQKEYFVTLQYEDTQSREVDLALRFVLPQRYVTVRPKAVWFYQFNDQPSTQEVVVTDQRLRKLQITEIESSANVLAARIKSSGETENGDRQFILDVEATGLVKPGRHRELITLHTNDEEYPLIQLPVVIERRSGEDDPVPDSGRVIIDPPTLRLTTAAGSTADCVVQTQNGDPIRVKQITTDPPFVSAGHTQVVGTADAFRLRVSIDETLPKQKLRAIVSIQTVDGRELTVPVQIIPAAE